MREYRIDISNKVCATLYVRAENGKEAWEKAQAWQITEDHDDVYLDEDRHYEDHWSLDTIEEV